MRLVCPTLWDALPWTHSPRLCQWEGSELNSATGKLFFSGELVSEKDIFLTNAGLQLGLWAVGLRHENSLHA